MGAASPVEGPHREPRERGLAVPTERRPTTHPWVVGVPFHPHPEETGRHAGALPRGSGEHRVPVSGGPRRALLCVADDARCVAAHRANRGQERLPTGCRRRRRMALLFQCDRASLSTVDCRCNEHTHTERGLRIHTPRNGSRCGRCKGLELQPTRCCITMESWSHRKAIRTCGPVCI